MDRNYIPYVLAMQQEIESRYAFLGGAEDEWIKYLLREEVPAAMWTFIPFSCRQGFSSFQELGRAHASWQGRRNS